MTSAVAKVDNQAVEMINFALVSKWIQFAQVSASSVRAYEKGIKRLKEYFTARQIFNPTRADLISYRDYLAGKYQPTTANLYITSAKLFFGFLEVEGYISNNPATHLKGLKVSTAHKKNALSAEQTKAILRNFNTSTLAGKRDYAIYLLMTTCGLRCVEVQRANISDLEKIDGVYRLRVQGKGRTQKDNFVNVPAGVYAAISNYLKKRGGGDENAPLFASLSHRNFDGRLTTFSISRIIKNALRENGLNSPRLTAHSLRHTTATTALKYGASIREVQQLLRHTKIDTTCIYLHELDALKNQASTFAANAFGI